MRISLTAPKTVKFLIDAFKILSILVCLSSCTANRAPVQDRMISTGNQLTYHIVSRGETLYAIAWRYGLDYKDLANRNGIDRHFTIRPGQKIYLKGIAVKAPPATPAPGRPSVVQPIPSPSPPSRSKTTTNIASVPKRVSAPSNRVIWQWPAKGKVLAGFSSHKSVHMGVDLDGRLGEAVVAAADGVVVYAGSGIRGYGNLLIVKHNETYLSAYAHNSTLVVQEKTTVRAGQKIAEIGSSGTDRSKLHFEIRREGKPVDPLQYLPGR